MRKGVKPKSPQTARIKKQASNIAEQKIRTARVFGALKRILFSAVALLLIASVSTGCAEFLNWDEEIPHYSPRPEASATDAPEATDTPAPQSTPSATEAPTEEPTEAPTEEPTGTEEPTDEPTEAPRSVHASLGFAGDVLIMQSQIASAATGNGYDFKDMFRPMQPLFESVDFMVLNFEGTLAGAAAGYTGPKPTQAPATEENPNPPKYFQRFNAPDEIVDDLMAL